MIRIGFVNIDTSHPGAFAEYMLEGNRARCVSVYNDGFRGDDEVDGFIARYGLEERFHSLDEMAGAVDIGFVLGCNWDAHLAQAMPFLDRGKPVFINKPMVGNLRECRMLDELAGRGAVILGSSSLRYAEELLAFRALAEAERGKILHVYLTVGMDVFNYAIHISEAVCGLVGAPVRSCRFVDSATAGGKLCENYAMHFQNDVTASYSVCHGVGQPFEMVVTTTQNTFHYALGAAGHPYGGLLDRIFLYIETGENTLAPVPELTGAIRALLAARISRRDGGREVALADIPEDDPGYDGAAFAAHYAAKAGKLYL